MSRANTLLAACALLVAFSFNVGAQADETDETANGGMSPEQVEALLAINLDKKQRGPFGAELRKYSTNLQAAIRRITRLRNPDQPRAIKRKTRSITKTMDKAMRKILRDDQWAAYEAYKVQFTKPPQLQADNSTESNAGFDRPATGY